MAAPRPAERSRLERLSFWIEFQLELWLARAGIAAGPLRRLNMARLRRWVRLEKERRTRLGEGLNASERRVFSQNGEDGLLEELFRRIGVTSRTCLEFGAGDGSENCTRNLLEHHGWTGFWFEGDAVACGRAKQAGAGLNVVLEQRLLDRENILATFAAAAVPVELDLLVVDVDGNDYWLWQKVCGTHRPRVVVVEYNGAFTPGIEWVMRYQPGRLWDRSWLHGASLDSLTVLGGRLGYRLVACDSNGVNAFFVLDDIAARAGLGGGDTADYYYAPKGDLLSFGHPKVPRRDPPMHPLPAGDAERVQLEVRRAPSVCPAGELTYLDAVVTNGSAARLSSGEPNPVNLSYHWLEDGRLVVFDGARTRLARPVQAGDRRALPVAIRTPERPGRHTLRVTLVQEGVRWFDEGPAAAYCDLPCLVTDD